MGEGRVKGGETYSRFSLNNMIFRYPISGLLFHTKKYTVSPDIMLDHACPIWGEIKAHVGIEGTVCILVLLET